MTAVERAAEVIAHAYMGVGYLESHGASYFVPVAQALADAGLLLSDQQAAVIDAAKAWHPTKGRVRDRAEPALIAAVDALNEAGQ